VGFPDIFTYLDFGDGDRILSHDNKRIRSGVENHPNDRRLLHTYVGV